MIPTTRLHRLSLFAAASAAALGTAAVANAQTHYHHTTPATAPTQQTPPNTSAPTDPMDSTRAPAKPASTPADQLPPSQQGTPTTDSSATTQSSTASGQTNTTSGVASTQANTAQNPSVGGAAMLPTKTIVENASAASNLTTLVSAVKAAGLAETLSSSGPFTVFAPTNDAFSRLAPGTVDTLLKPENKATLVKVLKYHVVPGTITMQDLRDKAAANGGKVTLTTVEGEPLTVDVSGQMITLTDVNGNKSYVQTADVRQSNGIVHVVNGVILPKLS